MIVIYPGARGNVMQTLTWKCGVPECDAEEVHEEVAAIGEAGPDPMLEGPDGWRLVHRMWICADHVVLVDHEPGSTKLWMGRGDDHWTRDGGTPDE